MKLIKYSIGILAFLLGLSSCSDSDLEPTLQQSKSIETSINSVNDLQAIINGAYERLSASSYYGRDKIILGEVFSDNCSSNANSNRFVAEAQMDLLPQSGIAASFWSQAYGVIASSNIVIAAEGIEGDQALINQLKGQAYALRALVHFDLLTYYGQQNVDGGGLSSLGVPYVVSFRDNNALFPSRNTVQEVRDMAYEDLTTAYSLMSVSLNDSKEYISTFAVKGIEARIANYFGDFGRSLSAAQIIVNSQQFSVASSANFANTFAIDQATNSIFEIAFSATDNPGINGLANIYQPGSYGDVIALPNLAEIYEDDDVRGVGGIITEYANGTLRNTGKYPSTAPYEDNVPVIRYEEVVLLYAEALLETGGNPATALTFLNQIPSNRNATPYAVVNKNNILLERRKELAFEGFRFHDLARTRMNIPNPDPVLQLHGGPTYGSYNYALPIPASEADVNANVVQNFGY